MQFSEVKQVKQVIGAANANTLLNEGWQLLTVVPATVNNGNASAMYVLGKNESAPDKKDAKISPEALASAHQAMRR
jgi:hypothetical protein